MWEKQKAYIAPVFTSKADVAVTAVGDGEAVGHRRAVLGRDRVEARAEGAAVVAEVDGLHRGEGRRHLVDRRGVVPAMTVKGALHVGIAAWLLHDRHQHPRRAFWTAVGLTAAQVAVNIGNTRRLRGLK